MSTSRSGRTRTAVELVTIFLVACLAVLATAATAGASRPHHANSSPVARAARLVPHTLSLAARRSTKADHLLVAEAKKLKKCHSKHPRQPQKCKVARRGLERAGNRLAATEQRLAHAARSTGRASGSRYQNSTSARQTPQLSVSGQTLTWTRIARVNSYVLARKVPGQAVQYSVVNSTSVKPPSVPGATVGYSVRTAVNGSAWSTEKSIAYPLPAKTVNTSPPSETAAETVAPTETTPPTETAPPVEAVNTQTAPILTVSGQTLTWNQIGGVSTYVLVQRTSGQADQYSSLSGISTTPAPVPGATVHYSIRTAVDGSAWSPEVAITYLAAVTSSPAPAQSATGPFEMGIVPESLANSEPGIIQRLGGHSVRMEFPIGAPASELQPYVEAYAKVGIRLLPMAGFPETIPTATQAQNLASWAATYGPGGSFWKGKSYPAGTAVTDIEFGNETSYTYQFTDNSTSAVAARAQTYAVRIKEANEAIHSVNSTVGLLAQADDGDTGSSTWVANMFKAVPQLAQVVAGWTVHPYGPTWQTRIDAVVAQTQAAGAPNTVPIYVTEWGLATDNGRCLSDNYGWNKCMSYQEAASTLGSTVEAMRARYGSRLHALYLYQAQDQSASGTSTDREQYFGALQNNGAPKGPYTAEVESLLTSNP